VFYGWVKPDAFFVKDSVQFNQIVDQYKIIKEFAPEKEIIPMDVMWM
jgi:hypothetical protein